MKLIKAFPARFRLQVQCLSALGALTLAEASAAPMQQAYVKASHTNLAANFGSAVSLSLDFMVVGAQYEASSSTGVNGNQNDVSATDAGAAYVFLRNGSNWTQQSYLKASNTGAGDEFGTSVAISGTTVAVGAPREDGSATGVNGNQSGNSGTNSGAAYVFVLEGTNWIQQAYVKPSNTRSLNIPGVGYIFGWSVAISGDTIVVGAPNESSNGIGVNGAQNNTNSYFSGAAYVFVRSGTNWSQQAYLKASNAGSGDYFGWSVALSGDTIVVGARYEGSSALGVNGNQSDNSAGAAGAAYVFVRNGTTWTQQAYLKASNTEANDQFGVSVAASDETIVVGAYWESSNATGVNGNQNNNNALNAGAAYVFVRNGATWSQQAFVKASNPDPQDKFGWRTAISGDTIVIGARQEASNATGIDGNQNDNSAVFASAAYVFVRNGTNWSQQSYVKASNTRANNEFGWAVAVAGSTVVVGAWSESSNATGLNGDQSNSLTPASGAVYVFSGFGTGPRLTLIPDGMSGQFVRFHGTAEVLYRVQRAINLLGPWETMATLAGSGSGMMEFHDTMAPAVQAFYRAALP